ncbi:MAG: hypothetical protein KJP00_12340 [Bacteroidia bacterium]|nr:hypothetical protein [Bacteroidia bacterium]
MLKSKATESSQVFYEGNGRSITLENYVSEEVIEFLSRIQFGYVGTLYEHKNTREIILRMTNPNVLVVRINGQIAVTSLFSKRELKLNDKTYDAYYIRYLAADEQFQGRGIVAKYGVISMNWMRKVQEKPTVFYNFVEEQNRSSYRLIEFVKFKQIGGVRTIGFSRVFPRSLGGLERIEDFDAYPEFKSSLAAYYQKYNVFNLFDVKYELPYYVYKINGEIVAGVQPHKAQWVLNSLPGTLGKIALSVIPHMPYLKRIVNPKDFKFLGFEGFYFKPGHAQNLKRLLEGVLHDLKHYSALMWFDEKDPQLDALLAKKDMGLVYHFAKSSNTKVMVSFKGFTDEEQALFKERSLYISALDNM